MRRLLLVSPPWRLANWPCLAIGVLKSYLARRGIAADCVHMHFDVALRLGLERYGQVADGWELGEALYFALQSPDEADDILARVSETLRRRGQDELARWAVGQATREVNAATLASLDGLELGRYRLAGVSVGALQLGGAVYIAQELKRRAPHIRIVLGGTSVLGAPGANLLERLPFVDAVVDGEGEASLASLAEATADWSDEGLAAIPNLFYRTVNQRIVRSKTSTLKSLDDAFPADLDEYYAAARDAGYPRSGLVLPIEVSRGCAWEHRIGDGRLHGCTFCGLYRSSPDYREKGIVAAVADLRASVERSEVLDVSFVDAYLPGSYSKELLRQIADADMDLTVFCEMRCDLDQEIVELMSRAGVRRVQLGVEAFNTRILARMAKGTRLIDNVSSIKLCEEYGIPFQYNVITRFPGILARHIVEMADLLSWLRGFPPPNVADFYLDRSSRIFAAPTRYGIAPESLDRERLPFLPAALAAVPVTQFVSFTPDDRDEVVRAWQQVVAAIEAWKTRFDEVRALGIRQLLSYRIAGERLFIEDWREEEVTTMTLEGPLMRILVACNRMIHRETLDRMLAEVSEREIDGAIAELRAHRLLVMEGEFLLGLPVRTRLPSGVPRSWSHAS